ncbi:PREDICTED: germin-like protein subfamily 1 member 1 [Tarenaya hassleriana]|uniref:germin-like protein subfamily 1 member 1 n=1 Tax=Tarenaya hassleriana TaxID=28532 RepID=UPI00053C3E23|nr:PREDICTED: germin-like protein subfamily 1 member 1 [Tarenaya hassleriana]
MHIYTQPKAQKLHIISATMIPTSLLLHLLLYLTLQPGRVKSDPDPLQDYCVADTKSPHPIFLNGAPCKDPTLATVADFTTSALSESGDTRTNQLGINVTLTTTTNLPGLNTMGLAMARIDFAGRGVVPPHAHPRASEVTICLEGVLLVGFVDTSGRVFTQELHAGESFVFPKGLIHFLYNIDSESSAMAVSGLSSQNPGTQIASLASFASKPPIPEEVLERAFRINAQDVARIRKNLGG